jgi:FAD/FMN-containing dehydrogenase/Fe-S oxidoreductase
MTEPTDVRLPVLDVADAERERVAEALAERIEGEVRFSQHDRMLYATDASIYQVEPIGVVTPRSRADVVAIVEFAAERGLPVLPRGAGTGLAGQTVNTALVIDFSPHCTDLLAVDPAARTARVQPGIVLDHLNGALAGHGLMFGPDVATSTHATLGGMIGNNSAGAHSVLYGRTVEHLRGLDVVLADGQAVRLEEGAAAGDARVRDLTERVLAIVDDVAPEIDGRFPRTQRRVNGYNLDLLLAQQRASTPGTSDRVNLAHLLCGAEGTLGVTVEAELDLVPVPSRKGLAIVTFPSVDDALLAVVDILATAPAAVELVDDVIIDLAGHNLEHRRAVELLSGGGAPPRAVLYVEYFADDPADIERAFAGLDERFGTSAVHRYTDAASMARAWRLRKAGEPLLHGLPGRRKPITFVEDLAVAPERLSEFVDRFRALLSRHGTTAAYYAHASVGCLHIRPLICLKDPDDVDRMERIIEEATDLVKSFDGALSGEHGDGRLRSHLLERFYGPALCRAFAAVREIFDPEGRLNPGNITAPPSMTDHLRVKPDETVLEVPAVETYFRYEREHGFEGAVEMCNGAGVCRRTEGGTMCPSYRATSDERHATRGRGNALRLAITGQLGAEASGFADAETLATLDLCLSCKACKSECPSNVDIARLRAEYLAQGFDRGAPVPLSTRLFARVRQLNAAASWAPGLANALLRAAPIAAGARRVAGVHPRRSLPPFGPALARWHRSRTAKVPDDAPVVVLFPDCFTAFGESAIGKAAVGALEALGYRVHVPRVGCCGRPLISNGLLRRATTACAETAEALHEAVARTGAVAVVGCEPSCLSAIADDWRDLKLACPRERVDAVADRAALVEDFIEHAWSEHPRRPAPAETDDAPVLLHGHCHQKALWDVAPTLRLLGRLRGGPVGAIEAGCCGMAGAFGFARDHYDLSMRIGELALFPAVRDAPDAVIAAPGTSCRHQVHDALGRTARHPIELVAAALRG